METRAFPFGLMQFLKDKPDILIVLTENGFGCAGAKIRFLHNDYTLSVQWCGIINYCSAEPLIGHPVFTEQSDDAEFAIWDGDGVWHTEEFYGDSVVGYADLASVISAFNLLSNMNKEGA